jgi:hypothetical protein
MEPNSMAGWTDNMSAIREMAIEMNARADKAEREVGELREVMRRAFECLTRADTGGPYVTQMGVDAARMILAGCMDDEP